MEDIQYRYSLSMDTAYFLTKIVSYKELKADIKESVSVGKKSCEHINVQSFHALTGCITIFIYSAMNFWDSEFIYEIIQISKFNRYYISAKVE